MFLFAALIFFTSGVPALVYQITWQRILALHSGVGIYSVAMIVAAFMAGLGIGSELGGRLSQRFGPSGALWGFALIELSIGGFALLSPWLYYDVLYERFGWLYERPWLAGVCHFGALLLPTGLMGMSLPMLVRAMVLDSAHACRTIGYLYAVNGLGAAVGALLTPWVLIPRWGIAGAIYAAVMLNLAAGCATLVLALFSRGRAVVEPTSALPVSPVEAAPLPEGLAPAKSRLGVWALLYATSGFCALGLEIVWFRLIDVGVKSTAFTFGTVLAIFLTGLAFGSAVGAHWEQRWQQPRRLFLLLQMLIACYAALSIGLLVWLPEGTPIVSSYFEYWQQYDPFTPRALTSQQFEKPRLWALYLVFPAALLFVPTVLMGLSFAVLQRAVHDEPRTAGRKVGLLQAANIAGGVLGSLVIGLVAIEWLGTAGTLRLLVGLGLAFTILGLFEQQRRPFVIGGLLLVAMMFVLPGQDRLWRRLHGLRETSAWFGEDASGVVAIAKDNTQPDYWRISVNGKGHSLLPYGHLHTGLGVLSAIVHPVPIDVAIIGLGSGDTAWAAACRPETQRVDVFEICAPERNVLEQLDRHESLPQLQRLLQDERVHLHHADGRISLRASDQLYDVIEADASRPDSAYGGNLYSEEFFRECSARLKPGGLMCTWCPTPRTYATFCRVFPYVLDGGTNLWTGSDLLIGSHTPLEVDMPTLRARLNDARVAEYLGQELAEQVAQDCQYLAPAVPATVLADELASNHDLFPRDEFHHDSRVNRALQVQAIGEIYLRRGQVAEAIQWLQEAIRLAPELSLAHTQLAFCYLRPGFDGPAQVELNEALRLAPDNTEPAYYLGRLLLTRGAAQAAVPLLRRAAEHQSTNAAMAAYLAQALSRMGDARGAIEWYRTSLERDPNRWETAQELAWLLATDADPNARDPQAALALAQQAVRDSREREALALDTLAAAYAATGDFASAADLAERALNRAKQQREQTLVEDIPARLELYRAEKSFVQPAREKPAAG
ncbi:MAG: fused MFS/spermidine synthase [Pirellulales bacterium]|nr:fused MFS/spermidine synthase [Pirellulales bacterium]